MNISHGCMQQPLTAPNFAQRYSTTTGVRTNGCRPREAVTRRPCANTLVDERRTAHIRIASAGPLPGARQGPRHPDRQPGDGARAVFAGGEEHHDAQHLRLHHWRGGHVLPAGGRPAQSVAGALIALSALVIVDIGRGMRHVLIPLTAAHHCCCHLSAMQLQSKHISSSCA
jgi:hypothetical protein